MSSETTQSWVKVNIAGGREIQGFGEKKRMLSKLMAVLQLYRFISSYAETHGSSIETVMSL